MPLIFQNIQIGQSHKKSLHKHKAVILHLSLSLSVLHTQVTRPLIKHDHKWNEEAQNDTHTQSERTQRQKKTLSVLHLTHQGICIKCTCCIFTHTPLTYMRTYSTNHIAMPKHSLLVLG